MICTRVQRVALVHGACHWLGCDTVRLHACARNWRGKSSIHRALASISAVLLIPALLVLSQQNEMGMIQKTAIILSVAVMTVITGLVVLSGGKHKYFLVLQALYFAAFFAPIIFISYL